MLGTQPPPPTMEATDALGLPMQPGAGPGANPGGGYGQPRPPAPPGNSAFPNGMLPAPGAGLGLPFVPPGGLRPGFPMPPGMPTVGGQPLAPYMDPNMQAVMMLRAMQSVPGAPPVRPEGPPASNPEPETVKSEVEKEDPGAPAGMGVGVAPTGNGAGGGAAAAPPVPFTLGGGQQPQQSASSSMNTMMNIMNLMNAMSTVGAGVEPGQAAGMSADDKESVMSGQPLFPLGINRLLKRKQDDVPPNRTLYVNNLNDRIKIDRLKRELRAMFENFGEVKEVIAMKSFWRRGQAWVVFATQEAADKALNGLQGFPYVGKPLRLNYAREESDVHSKQEGTFKERPPGPRKPRAIVEREQQLQQHFQQLQLRFQQSQQQLRQQQELAQQAHQASQAGQAHSGAPGGGSHPGGLAQGLSGFSGGHGLGGLPQGALGVQASLLGAPNLGGPVGAAPGATAVAASGSLRPSNGGPSSSAGQSGSSAGGSMTKDQLVAAMTARAEAASRKRTADSGPTSNGAPGPIKVARLTFTAGGSASAAAAGGGDGASAGTGSATIPTAPSVMVPAASRFFNMQQPSTSSTPAAAPFHAASGEAPPNRTLFIQNLPPTDGSEAVPGEDASAPISTSSLQELLEGLFKAYPGFLELRIIAPRRVAFVDYENERQAGAALAALNNYPLKEDHSLRLSYAKR